MWSVSGRAGLPCRLAELYAGLLLYGGSLGLLVRADVGLGPWDVFHQGVSAHTGLSIGAVSILAGGFGAAGLGAAAGAAGPGHRLAWSLAAWTVTVAAGYFLPSGAPAWFFVLAAAIGLVMGGSQALSRSLFSQLVPAGKEAEYFSLYEMSDRGTSWLGPLIFGLTYQLTGSYRDAILSLVVFFVLGFAVLVRTPVSRAAAAAGNPAAGRI